MVPLQAEVQRRGAGFDRSPRGWIEPPGAATPALQQLQGLTMNYQAGGSARTRRPGSGTQLTRGTAVLRAEPQGEGGVPGVPRKAACSRGRVRSLGTSPPGRRALPLKAPSGELLEALAALSCEAPTRLGEAADRVWGRSGQGRTFLRRCGDGLLPLCPSALDCFGPRGNSSASAPHSLGGASVDLDS